MRWEAAIVVGGRSDKNIKSKMADSSADTRVNLAALKRVDPYAIEIVETGTQVAIYKFNSQSNEWVRNISIF